MLRSTLLALSRRPEVKKGLVAVPLTRRVVQRFVSGEQLEDCLRTVRELKASGLLATVDFLGEDTVKLEQATATADAYVTLLERLDAEGLADVCEASVKLTAVGLGLAGGENVAFEQASRVCAAAQAAGTTVTIDMEDHTATDATLRVVDRLRETYPATGTVLQAYLKRTPDDCARYATSGSRIRLCKGAYDEPESVAYRDKRRVDAAYLDCLGILMRGEGYPMVASHDSVMLDSAVAMAERAGRGRDTYELQMLYGIRTDEQRRLAMAGHRVRVYVPFGTDWYGYFTRRLAERPANLLFFARALVGR